MNAIKSLLSNVVGGKQLSQDSYDNVEPTTYDTDSSFSQNIENGNENSTYQTNNMPSEMNAKIHDLKLTSKQDPECKILQETVFDLIRGIIDPEKPQTLEDLEVVNEEDVLVYKHNSDFWIRLEFTPTVPHCSLASIIGLCLRRKLETFLPDKHKLDIYIKEGTHSTAEEINKQINDKERIAAAMENPNLLDLVNKCIAE